MYWVFNLGIVFAGLIIMAFFVPMFDFFAIICAFVRDAIIGLKFIFSNGCKNRVIEIEIFET